mmetsp:Transcript_17168/g.47269  ORF Transcript_17168/g.47269 Transcript_17168/m.47269 type:complete len:302 (-) Transcript_17168:335-1240(-)
MGIGKWHPPLQLVPNRTILTANDVKFVHRFRLESVTSLDVPGFPALHKQPDHPHQHDTVPLRGGNHRVDQHLSFLRRHQSPLHQSSHAPRCQYGTMRSRKRRVRQQVEQPGVSTHELENLSRRHRVGGFFVGVGGNHTPGMRGQVHVHVVEPALEAPAQFHAFSPQSIGLVHKEGQRKGGYRKQLSPEGVEPGQMCLENGGIGFVNQVDGHGENHVPCTRNPCFGKHGSFPPTPNPSTGRIELHHDGSSRTRPHTFVDEIVQQVHRGSLFDNRFGCGQHHVQSGRGSTGRGHRHRSRRRNE